MGKCNELEPVAEVSVESILVVGCSLVDELIDSQRVEILKMIRLRHVNIRIEVVMTQERILGGESGDELVACVSHAVSMAENRGKVKRWWTESELVGFVLGLQLAHLSIDHAFSMAHNRAKVKR